MEKVGDEGEDSRKGDWTQDVAQGGTMDWKNEGPKRPNSYRGERKWELKRKARRVQKKRVKGGGS